MKRAIAAAAGSVALAGAWPSAALAQARVETGWWTRSPVASAPDGGVAVAVAPDGPVSVAALRLDTATPTIELVETGGTATSLAAIQGCASSSPWTPAEGGPLEEAPEPDCEAGVVGFVRGADGTWSANVTPLPDDGATTIVLVPVDGGPPVFEVQFEAPRVAGEADVPAAPSPSSTTTTRPASATATAPTPGRSAPPAPSPPLVPRPVQPAALPAPGAPVTTTTAGQPEVAIGPVRFDVDTSSGEGPRTARALLFVVVAAVAGLTAGGTRRRLRVRRVRGAAPG